MSPQQTLKSIKAQTQSVFRNLATMPSDCTIELNTHVNSPFDPPDEILFRFGFQIFAARSPNNSFHIARDFAPSAFRMLRATLSQLSATILRARLFDSPKYSSTNVDCPVTSRIGEST